jgi:hypothetical protein
MVPLRDVETQLKQLGVNHRFWGRPEMLELQHILVPGEQIQACINGHYKGGFATFCVTDQRLLLIDKKLFFLTVEDMRFDMITEIDFSAQLVTGNLSVCTPTKTMHFTTLRPKKLRELSCYVQNRVMEIRQDFGLHPQSRPPVQSAPTPLPESAMVELTELPAPRRLNPYMGAPLMMRRRIGRLGPIGSSTATSPLSVRR